MYTVERGMGAGHRVFLVKSEASFECEWMSASSPSGILANFSRQGQMLVIDSMPDQTDAARIVCHDAMAPHSTCLQAADGGTRSRCRAHERG